MEVKDTPTAFSHFWRSRLRNFSQLNEKITFVPVKLLALVQRKFANRVTFHHFLD